MPGAGRSRRTDGADARPGLKGELSGTLSSKGCRANSYQTTQSVQSIQEADLNLSIGEVLLVTTTTAAAERCGRRPVCGEPVHRRGQQLRTVLLPDEAGIAHRT